MPEAHTTSHHTNVSLDAALTEARERYVAANPRSLARHEAAKAVMPGGNTRSILHFAPFPVAFVEGQGARLRDADGHDYVDFLGEYTAGLYGHSNPVIAAAVQAALADGIVLGGPNLIEAELARLICERFPAIERVRFCNSGTEANVLALSAARAFTGRSDILVARRSYHGGFLSFAAESPLNLPFPTHFMDFNDTQGAVELIHRLDNKLAAVLVEPMVGAGGGIPGDPEFLAGLRRATEATGAQLIFDEVMTSRLTAGGLHGHLSLRPDLVTLGKYIGGGLTFGAFGGRAEILDRFDPARPGAWPHAGTFNNNILTMAAGRAGLAEVYTPAVADAFFERGNAFREALSARLAKLGLPVQLTGLGSMMVFHIAGEPPTAPPDPKAAPADLLELLHLDMIDRGFFHARRGMINLSLPMTDTELEGFTEAFETVLESRAGLIEVAAE